MKCLREKYSKTGVEVQKPSSGNPAIRGQVKQEKSAKENEGGACDKRKPRSQRARDGCSPIPPVLISLYLPHSIPGCL